MGELSDSAKKPDLKPDWDWVEARYDYKTRVEAKRLYNNNPTMPFAVAVYHAREKLTKKLTREFCRGGPLDRVA